MDNGCKIPNIKRLKIPYFQRTISPRGEKSWSRTGIFFVIKDMKPRGMSIMTIAEELGRDRKTISRWLKQEYPETYQSTVEKPSMLESYKYYVVRRMKEGCVNAVVILDDIRSAGYKGGITILRDMKPFRTHVSSKNTTWPTGPS